MIGHFVIMSSSYSLGKRIALHYIVNHDEESEFLLEEIKKIADDFGDFAPISTHYIETEDKTWESIVEVDAFFEEVKVVKGLTEFVELIQDDRELRAIDVAKYILSTVTKCTHLKLEKLVYLCYADYLCDYGKRLFDEKIIAYKYGPVIDSVYEVYKGKRTLIRRKDSSAMRSRILFCDNGMQKLMSIDRTIATFGRLTAHELVDITHREGAPWSQVKDEYYATITDDLIRRCHYLEKKIIE